MRSIIAHFKAGIALALAWLTGGRRRRWRPGEPASVVLYDHSFSGNVRAFFQWAAGRDLPYDVRYATIDRCEYDRLANEHGDAIVDATTVSGMKRVMGAACIMTGHGPGVFYPLKRLCPATHFVDVWHGVGFKGYTPEGFHNMHHYTACFISGEGVKVDYIDNRGFTDNQLIVTGYGRLDALAGVAETAARVKRELKLGGFRLVLIYAPTFRVAGEAGEVPFGLSAREFLCALDALCAKIDAVLIFRIHLNSALHSNVDGYQRIRSISMADYAETNDLLAAADLLITDWSSIASDFCVLDRPVVWLDTPEPSTHNAVPFPIARGGVHAKDLKALVAAIQSNVGLSGQDLEASQRQMKQAFYGSSWGDTLDGRSCERYDEALRRILDKPAARARQSES